jgi:putative membrane-bound dehydrogenase-like protein
MTAALPAQEAVKRVVFLAGAPSHGPGAHEYRAGGLLLAKALNEQSGLPVKAEVVSGWPEDAALLKGAAAVVVYDSATKVIGKHWEEMDALANAGTGLMFLHYAVHPSADMGEKYYRPWTGGAFESGFSVNPFWVADLTAMPDHPVARGITAPIRARDEFYYNIRFRPEKAGVLDLATATPSRENMVTVNNLWTQAGYEGLGKSQTLMWGTQRENGGRGVGFTGGHYHRNWALDDYRKLVLNAIVWCAGMEVPEGGVKSLPLTEDDLNANLDKKGNNAERIALPIPGELDKLPHGSVPTVAEHAAARKAAVEKKQKKAPAAKPEPQEVQPDALGNPEPTATVPTKPAEPTKPAAPAKEASAPPQPPVSLEPQLVPVSQIKVPEDLEVTVWASSPMLFNPTNMDTDKEGRIWVAEGVNYRKKKNRRPDGDRIVVLEDSDHDGRADKSHVFVQDPELVSPLGVSVFGNKVVVAQPPNLIVYTDVDGDLRFDPAVDKRENLLTGFMGANHDHSLHAVVAGPDGRWHINQGNTGAEFTTRDGVTYRVGGPYGPGVAIAGAKSDDGRIWTGGFAATMEPDGTKLRMIGHGFRNSYEHCVNSLGDVYQNDNDDPPACRTTWLMEGGFMGFFSRSGKRTWEADRRRGQSVPVAEWRQEDPGTLPPGDIYGRGAPTGIAYYENGALPSKYEGMLVSAESRLQTLYGYYPQAEGAGKKMERLDFLVGEEGTSFRPSDVMVGADGALYVADWFDLKVGGHGTQDDSLSGAIYRIAPKGFQPKVATAKQELALLSLVAQAIALIKSPAANVRFEGLTKLRALAAEQPATAEQAISQLLADDNASIRARGAWLLPSLGESGLARVREKLTGGEPDQRLLALRILRSCGYDLVAHPDILQQLVVDPSPAVRREAAVALRELPAPFKQPLVAKLLETYDGKDRTYLEACGLAAEGIEEPLWAQIFETQKTPQALDWTPTFARITWRLQSPAAIPALIQRAESKALPMEARKLAVDTIAFTRSRPAIEAMVKLRSSDPEIAQMADAWLLIRATDEWEEFGGREVLKEQGIYDPDKVVIQEVKVPEPPKNSTLPPVGTIAQLKGDAANGKVISTRCVMCHTIQGQGVDYGPNLDGWVANQGLEAFLTAVTNPSESIALGFEGERVPLVDGREVQGILISAADPLTVRSTGGMTQMIPRTLLNKRTLPLNRSLMLSADQLGLTAQDLADLAAYLKECK